MNTNTIQCFPPIINEDSRIIVLGTMPGKISIDTDQYYANGDNLFWDIMYRIFDPDWPPYALVHEEVLDYNERVKFLQKNKVALWDVLKYCDRKNSLDRDIRNEIVNDLEDPFHRYEQLRIIAFNGEAPQEYFMESYSSIIKYYGIKTISLPSTSPTYRCNPFKKIKQWKEAFEI